MPTPSVGRVVWVYPTGNAHLDSGSQPYAAIVCYVHGDRLVNLAVFGTNGAHSNHVNVPLVQEGDEPPAGEKPFCGWMPYQIGQAKKYEDLKEAHSPPKTASGAEAPLEKEKKGK
jgi:hypothetical protein